VGQRYLQQRDESERRAARAAQFVGGFNYATNNYSEKRDGGRGDPQVQAEQNVYTSEIDWYYAEAST